MEDAQKLWDKAADSFQRVYDLGINEYNRGVLSYLSEKGALFPGARVLDIGCGVGKYGTYFAALGCDVTLTDISGRMLEHAERNMSRFSSPWRVFRCDFAAVSPEHPLLAGKYDLTVSTMCPVIYSAGGIEKMSAVTDGLCFFADFISWKQENRDKVIRALGLPPLRDDAEMHRRADELIGRIRATGYAPEVLRVPYCWCDMRSAEKAAEAILSKYSGYSFDSAFVSEAEAVCTGLTDENGLFRDSIETEVVWISWRT